MVVKPNLSLMSGIRQFESRVILDGSQTEMAGCLAVCGFESRVILDGSQTALGSCMHVCGV